MTNAVAGLTNSVAPAFPDDVRIYAEHGRTHMIVWAATDGWTYTARRVGEFAYRITTRMDGETLHMGTIGGGDIWGLIAHGGFATV